MRVTRRLALGGIAAAATIVLTAGPGLAHECINASRNGAAGAQIILGADDSVLWISNGLQHRIDKGLVDLAEELIQRQAGPFSPEAFSDSYSNALEELVKAKLKGRKAISLEEEKPEEGGGEVVDLMEALKKSLGGKSGRKSKGSSSAKASKTSSSKSKSSGTRKRSSGKAA